MSKKEIKLKTVLSAGIIKENPVLRSALGLCPVLAVTTSALNGLGMGIATALVLVLSNMVTSLLRKVIPDKVRIPANILIISAIVTMIGMLIRAFAPALDDALGIFLPLIAVNCIVFGRVESFARKNKVLPSMVDGLGMGIGNIIALILIGSLREIIGAGSWFGMVVNSGQTIQLFILPPGGLLALAFLVALTNKIAIKKKEAPASLNCRACPSFDRCSSSLEMWN